MSEKSDSPYPKTAAKHSSTPIGMMASKNRQFDIPIRMSALDESSSATISEENLPHKTTSDTLNMEKMLKKMQPSRGE